MRAVLWDMDGTLIDSEEYHWIAWRDTLGAERRPITREQFQRTFGWRNDAILRDLLGSSLSPSEVARIGSAKEALYRQLVRERGISLLPGVAEWLARLRGDGWKQAVASSAPPQNLAALLDALAISFDAVVSAETVEHGKPAPDLFLAAARAIGVPPARCVVVEDAAAGVEAAHRGGMKAVGVLTSQTSLAADVVVRRLNELPQDAFERLVPHERGMR